MELSSKAIARIIALNFFAAWVLILWMGADHPVPMGFIVVVLIALAAAFAVFWRVPQYLVWHHEAYSLRWVRILGEGLAAGVVIALVMMLLPGTGDPSAPDPGFIDTLVWFIIMGIMGMANAMLVYGASTVIERITKKK